MAKYVAVDCGKYDTKVAVYDAETAEYKRFKFRTKVSSGTFEDDMLGANTYLSKIGEGAVCKVGAEARKEAELETSKRSDIHKTCTLTAIALAIAEGHVEQDYDEEVNVVVGIPYQTCCIVEERLAYKDYILPKEPQKIQVKTSSSGPVVDVSFHFGKRLVYPESIGVLYRYPQKLSGITGVIDIGNLNINAAYCDSFMITEESSFTDELGGKILISGLAQQLTTEMNARCSEDLVAKVLTRGLENRCLNAKNGDKTIDEKSRKIIDAYLLEHTEMIKRKCDSKRWPLSFMNLAMIGGTSQLLSRELKIVFGENIFIPGKPEFVNVEGFLKKMCADDNIEVTTGEDQPAEKTKKTA